MEFLLELRGGLHSPQLVWSNFDPGVTTACSSVTPNLWPDLGPLEVADKPGE